MQLLVVAGAKQTIEVYKKKQNELLKAHGTIELEKV